MMKSETIDRIRKFTEERDWDKFHSPSNLAKSIVIEAAEYSVGEILEVAEGTLAPVACLMDDAEDCPRANQCRTLPMWKKFDSLVHDFFYNITLEQILEDSKFLPEE